MASKKTKGKGKNKRYVVRYDGGNDPKTGKRIQKQKTFMTSKEADEFLALVTLQTNEKVDPPLLKQEDKKEKEHIPFRQYVERWYNTNYYQEVRPSTFKNARFFLNKHIYPFFEDKALDNITSQDITEFYALKKKEGYADKTVSGIHKFLSKIFQDAVDKGDLIQHPMQGIKKKPKDPVRIGHPWSYAEVVQFLEVAEGEEKDLLYDFTLSTGLRQGEVLSLAWFNIDFEQATVTVTQSLSYDDKQKPELFLKSQSSYRTLSLPKYLIKKLQAHKEQQENLKERMGDAYHHELNLVFPNISGGFLNPSNVRRQMYNLMDKAGVRRITFHELRHTHASLLIRNGAHPKIVMGRLGHKDIETTLRYYAHLWPNADQEAIQDLEEQMARYKNPQDQM